MGRTEYDPIRKKAVQKRTITSALMIFIGIPALIALSTLLDNGKFFMLCSLGVVICCMAPFFMVFEKRKPKAREIVLIAMMSAITVACHMFFHITIPIQIGTAMVIIAGISMGPEAGFLVGALSRFVCNFYMGQGPWTPWQMFCWGLLGFLAGLAFNKVDLVNATEKVKSRDFKVVMGPVLCIIAFEVLAFVSYFIFPEANGLGVESFGDFVNEMGRADSFKEIINLLGTLFGWRVYAFGAVGLVAGVLLQRKRMPVDNITITLFTFFTTLILYGGIINIGSIFTSAGIAGNGNISLDTFRTIYITGLPYDIVHAALAAFCMFVIGNPMIRKIERIKIKYGIYK
ncbi:MAG: ECF transporter S component [Firmicutes bacterium]|nr:ECF transporter S component [Bacillota bacterium]